ncbi:MAG: YMGG-like glycine zipper-containing protein [Desulfobacteraceae bacterium]
MIKKVALILVLALLLGSCAGMSYTEQRTLSGGALGAASGAAIGAIAGEAAVGAGIGAGAGLLGGYLYDRYEKYHGRP